MIPAAFEYHAPTTLRDALSVLRRYDGGARVLAGGMSLVPMMKLRLANPAAVVDLHRVGGLAGITETANDVSIGPMTTHYELESSPVVQTRLPLIAETAARIGDVQVRNRGTIGGSIAHADPAADLPAALIAADAVIRVAGKRRRTVPASRMFVDAYTTALADDEIITEIAVPVPPEHTGVCYQKLANRASRFAIVGVAALVTLDAQGACSRVRIGVTGAGPAPVRARTAERFLAGRLPSSENLQAAGARARRGIDFLEDVHGSSAYREHLTGELTRRALAVALGRARAQ